MQLPGQNTISIPPFGDKYSEYVKQLESGDTDIDYQDFRFSFIESQQFKVAWKKSTELRRLISEMYTEMNSSNYEKIISITKEMLSIDYTNMLAHRILRQTYQITGDSLNAEKYKTIQMGLLKSIIQNGDGKTCSTAWPVIQVSEEYFILNILGLKTQQQSLISKDGFCDQMDVVDKNGERFTYYFDVKKVFEGHKKLEEGEDWEMSDEV